MDEDEARQMWAYIGALRAVLGVVTAAVLKDATPEQINFFFGALKDKHVHNLPDMSGKPPEYVERWSDISVRAGAVLDDMAAQLLAGRPLEKPAKGSPRKPGRR